MWITGKDGRCYGLVNSTREKTTEDAKGFRKWDLL